MRLRFAAPIALALLVAALAALAPASLGGAWVSAASEGALRLADTSGTVWRGAGTLTDAPGSWRLPLAWRLSPLAALRGVADVELVPGGRVSVDAHSVAIADVHATMPARALAAVVPATIAVTIGGDIALDTPAFRYDGRRGDGTLTLRWDGARVIAFAGALVDLGTVSARVAPRGGDLVATITSAGGALGVAGEVVASNEQIAVDATLTPTPALPPDVAQLLAALGPPDPSGRIRVAWRGRRR
jgi:hypothetical protein